MGGHVNQAELRRSRHEREQAVKAELGIDDLAFPRSPRQNSSLLTIKGLRAQRSRREQKAAADLGVNMPESSVDDISLVRSSTGSIRRARLRREADAHIALEKERRQQEKDEAKEQSRRALERKRTRQEHLKRVRDLEGFQRPPLWRRLLSSKNADSLREDVETTIQSL